MLNASVPVVLLALAPVLLPLGAKAEPASAGVTAATLTCPATGEGMAACAAVGVAVHELLVADKPFGKNGEGMKVLRDPLGGKKSAPREAGRKINKAINKAFG